MVLAGTQLDGIALVVGASRGIGQQAAFSLAEAGACVVVFADMNEETARASAEENKRYATNNDYLSTHFGVNVTDDKGIEQVVDFVVKEFGRIDYAVNAAGARSIKLDNSAHAPLANTDIANFEHHANQHPQHAPVQAATMRK